MPTSPHTQNATLHTDKVGIRDASRMPPLLQRLSERQPENLDYLGTSYGVTPLLFKFWKRAGYVPLYMRQTTNDLTGEHSCVMLRGLNKNKDESASWLSAFSVGECHYVGRRSVELFQPSLLHRRFPETLHLAAVVQVPRVCLGHGSQRSRGRQRWRHRRGRTQYVLASLSFLGCR